MSSELVQAIEQVCNDKKISLESVIETIESALSAAYRKDFGNKLQNIKVEFDMQTGAFKVFDVKEAVEDELEAEYERVKEERMKMTDEERAQLREEEIEHNDEDDENVKKFNPKTMIGLSNAKALKPDIKIGEELVQNLEVPGDFGRMAAQTAKQVVIQKLREAERNTVLEEYQAKVGELLPGTVQRREGRVVLVDFGNTTAIMPLEEGIRSENYAPGSRFKFYLKSVEQGARGPKIIVSRTHPEILRKLFKLEVPEVASGSVLIKSIAREAGSRSKIAVTAKDDNIDPIGSCVGQRGTRVQTIINELGGEKIDIIEWEENPAKFIAKALAPASVIRVVIEEHGNIKAHKAREHKSTENTESTQNTTADAGQAESTQNTRLRQGSGGQAEEARETEEDGADEKGRDQEDSKNERGKASMLREATVYVAPEQLSLAIGREGQNVRLAAKLTGWRIDIAEEKLETESTENTENTQNTENTRLRQGSGGQAENIEKTENADIQEGKQEKRKTKVRNKKSETKN